MIPTPNPLRSIVLGWPTTFSRETISWPASVAVLVNFDSSETLRPSMRPKTPW